MDINRKFRYLNPGLYDRVQYLGSTHKLNDSLLLIKIQNLIKLLHVKPDKEKFCEVLGKVEIHLLKKSRYNLVLRNIPSKAIISNNKEEVPVTYSNLRDTLEQFGHVSNMYINYGVAYFDMCNARETHETLNNMKLGRNIITTCVI